MCVVRRWEIGISERMLLLFPNHAQRCECRSQCIWQKAHFSCQTCRTSCDAVRYQHPQLAVLGVLENLLINLEKTQNCVILTPTTFTWKIIYIWTGRTATVELCPRPRPITPGNSVSWTQLNWSVRVELSTLNTRNKALGQQKKITCGRMNEDKRMMWR